MEETFVEKLKDKFSGFDMDFFNETLDGMIREKDKVELEMFTVLVEEMNSEFGLKLFPIEVEGRVPHTEFMYDDGLWFIFISARNTKENKRSFNLAKSDNKSIPFGSKKGDKSTFEIKFQSTSKKEFFVEFKRMFFKKIEIIDNKPEETKN